MPINSAGTARADRFAQAVESLQQRLLGAVMTDPK